VTTTRPSRRAKEKKASTAASVLRAAVCPGTGAGTVVELWHTVSTPMARSHFVMRNKVPSKSNLMRTLGEREAEEEEQANDDPLRGKGERERERERDRERDRGQ